MSSFSMNIINSVAVVTFDTAEKRVNTFDLETIEEFKGILDDLEEMGADLKGAIFLSAKEKNFIAGADISLIAGITDPDEGAAMAQQGQELFDRVAALPFTTVAAIHGSCLGGGTELALACDHRVASDDPGTFIGLPETQLGIIPGFGGTQRLPRLVGLSESVRMITTGSPAYAGKALRIGLVDEVTEPELLMDAAMAAVAGDLPEKKVRRKGMRRKIEEALVKTYLGRKLLLSKARKAVHKSTHGHYPAPLAAIDSIEFGMNHGIKKGLEEENRIFGKLAVTRISKNLIRVFYLRESFAKGDPSPAEDIKRVAVIGGGAMGGGIAALAAEKGMQVRLVDMSEKALGAAIKHLDEDVKTKRKKHRYTGVAADWIPTRLTVDTQMRGIGSADVVIEAVAERMDVKKSVFAAASGEVADTAAILTNTSSLSVTRMASGVLHPGRVAGMHFFNPVDRMPLVEVIRGEQTSEETASRVAALARKLGKVPVIVKDSPGFLVNRLLLPYLNEACLLLEEGAGIEQVDRAMQKFGMPMGVFILLDQVGIDIVVHAGRSMFEGFGDRMKPSLVLGVLTETGRLGRKTGRGFYKYDGTSKRKPDPELKKLLAAHVKEKRAFNDDEIIHRLIYSMVNEATFCLEEDVVDSVEAVDAAMILGAGFPPFTGGLLRYADEIGTKPIAETLAGLAEDVDSRFEPSATLRKMAEVGEVFYP